MLLILRIIVQMNKSVIYSVVYFPKEVDER